MGRLRVRDGCANELGAAPAQCRLSDGCPDYCFRACGFALILGEVEEEKDAGRRGPVAWPGQGGGLDAVSDSVAVFLAVAAISTGGTLLGGSRNV